MLCRSIDIHSVPLAANASDEAGRSGKTQCAGRSEQYIRTLQLKYLDSIMAGPDAGLQVWNRLQRISLSDVIECSVLIMATRILLPVRGPAAVP
jgi:hypothetical protein